jgi:class 3 adenylate cyclase
MACNAYVGELRIDADSGKIKGRRDRQMAENFVPPRRRVTIVAFSGLVSLLRWAILAVVLLLLAPYALAYVENPRSYPATNLVLGYHERLVKLAVPRLQQYMPTTIAGRDRADWILIGGLVIVAIGIGSVRDRIVNRATARQASRHIQRWKESMQLGADSQAALALDARFKDLKTAKGVGRAELLRAFAEAKKNLDALGREVAFLSIDVVGSTAMKEREERAAVEYDFTQYRKLVEAVFLEQGVLKSTWTPDGVMACFQDIEHAVHAGKDVILRLEDFNKSVKLIRQNFQVRCGVNAGYVHFDEATPLEEMSDRVIDIAGHMQKHAEPNSVAVARKVIEPMRNTDGFEPTANVVDGYEVSRWKPARKG